MPFYEYQCKSCGHELEAMQKVTDPALKKCPHCGKSQLTRLMSAPVFRLKGGGWYETDFKEKDAQRNLADRPENEPKDSKGTEAKPAAEKADAKAEKSAEAPVKDSGTAKDKPADKPAQKGEAAKNTSRGTRSKKKPIKIRRRR